MQIKNFTAPILWALFIFCLSIIPGHDLPDFSWWRLIAIDKVVHMIMYGTLAFLLMRANVLVQKNEWVRKQTFKIALLNGFLFGGFIELFQEYCTADRHGDWIDVVANMIGTVVGIAAFRMFFKKEFVKVK